MSNFALDIRKFAENSKVKTDAVVKKVLLDVTKQVVQMSPVGDGTLWKTPPPPGYIGGRFRGNWQFGISAVPSGELDNLDNVGDGSKTYEGIFASIPDKAAGNIYYLANNLPYAQRLENGWSSQAPVGMVALTVVKWNSIVDQAVNGTYDRSSPGLAAGFKAYKV
ncbi:hypothetical protein ACO0LB_09995 [Undibacterium sp. SXout7W]|uniref:hypothetical protein n=1 Tax=Undibacterium sp. SXout7W TaxID=3413049 RepID=UPI003BF2B928